MSRYELLINGSPYTVNIVEISGAEATVDVNGVIYRVEIPGAALAPSASPGSGLNRVQAPALAGHAAVRPPAASRSAPAAAPKSAETVGVSVEGEVIAAPMPGHILGVSVKEGETVEVGDTVVVMEAMKMENEIKAHVAGSVLAVKVNKGQDVGVGEILVVIGAP